MNRSKFRSQEAFNVRQREFKPYEMGMQVPFGLDSQVPEKRAIWGVAETPWAIVQGPRLSKGEQNSRRASQARPCAYADLDSTQIIRFPGGRVSQGKERHPNCAGVPWEEKELYR